MAVRLVEMAMADFNMFIARVASSDWPTRKARSRLWRAFYGQVSDYHWAKKRNENARGRGAAVSYTASQSIKLAS